MLVLTTKFGKPIHIGDDITVTPLRQSGADQISPGIEAPKEIPVHRREVFEAIKSGDKKE